MLQSVFTNARERLEKDGCLPSSSEESDSDDDDDDKDDDDDDDDDGNIINYNSSFNLCATGIPL